VNQLRQLMLEELQRRRSVFDDFDAILASGAGNIAVEYLVMTKITIRNLDDEVKRKLQVRAAMNGRSMEAEALAILTVIVNFVPTAEMPGPEPAAP